MADAQDKLLQQTDPREALAEALRAIRRNWVRVAFTTAVFVMLGLFLTMLWPNKYESSTTFALREWQVVTDSVLIEELQDIPIPKKIKALENELRSRKRVDKVMNELQWPEWLDTAGKEADRRDLAAKLAKNLDVEIISDLTGTQNVSITFQWTSARKAADFVNRLRDSWIQLTLEGYKKSLEDRVDRMEAVLKDRQDDYQAALTARRTYEQENRIPSLLSPEVNNEIKGEQILKQQEARAELETIQGVIAKLTDQLQLIPREVEAPVPPATKEEAEAQVKLLAAEEALALAKDPITGYTELHWKRSRAQKDYDAAVAALIEAGGTVGPERTQLQTNPDYYDVAKQLEAAEGKEDEVLAVLSSIEQTIGDAQGNLNRLPQVTQDLADLDANVLVAQDLYAITLAEIQPLREKTLQFRAANFGVDSRGFELVSSGPFEILEMGVEPERPVLPISAIIMAVALVVGLGAGALGPVLAEVTRSSFGTVKEVSRSLGVPVLGAVDLILTQHDIRARRVQRALTFATMALVLLALGAGLYIYQAHPEEIPAGLRRALRDVRMALT
jgi:capsular polysaccharide biosynthesis protein